MPWKTLAGTVCFLALAVCAQLVGCGSQTQTGATNQRQQSLDPHAEMIQTLARIRDDALKNHSYFGKQTEIANDEDDLKKTKRVWAERRFDLQWKLANNHLRLGNYKEAEAYFESAKATLAQQVGLGVTADDKHRFQFDLAIGMLRIGEVDNCLNCKTGESCILPIQGEGIHSKTKGSKAAIKAAERVLKADPSDLRAVWLLNLAHMTLGTYPQGVPEKLRIPLSNFQVQHQFARFGDVARQLGLRTVNCAGGSIAEDFDGDGDLDVLTSDWHVAGQIRFFRNTGQGKFVEQTEEANLTGLFGGLNLVQADYDNDGDCDVLVLRGAWLGAEGRHPNSLLENDGTGRFRDVAIPAGLTKVNAPTQTASWADYDNDGRLDIFIGNESFPSQLFHNEGGGKFRDVAKAAGVENRRLTKGCVWGDFNNDRLPDLYVSNLDGPNRLYQNNGDGTFTDVAESAGVTKPNRSFPTWFWDYNNDGHLDLYVASYWVGTQHLVANYLGKPSEAELDCLYENDGKGRFRDVSAARGLTGSTQPMGANFGDLDNDGYVDMYLGTGFNDYQGLMPNLMFRNEGGKRFLDVTLASGTGHLQKGHGVSFADLNNDGNVDLFLQMGGTFLGDAFGNIVFQNPGGFGNNWIKIRLQGVTSNRSAIGARIHLRISAGQGKARSVYRWVNSGGSFGANPLRQHIGVGKAQVIDTLEIFWPTTNRTQRFSNVRVNQSILIREDQKAIVTGTPSK